MTRHASAPGRVNLLGEHVDHQGGTVLPVAIHMRTTVTYAPAEAWDIASEGHEPGGAWERYVRAVIGEVGEAAEPGRLGIRSTLPEGAGLASSAALEVAVAGALAPDMPSLELARLCRRAENGGGGVPCGLMDQVASACAIAGHAVVLDCDSETFFHLPLPELDMLLFDTGVRRSLADSAYAERAQEAATPGTPAARHVDEERARVDRAISCLDKGDARGLGTLMWECHASLRDLYRCSFGAADALVERLLGVPGVFGARLVGAGWGGAVLALVEPGTRLEGGTLLLSDDGLSVRE
ncbi:MAG TPA: galactokinase family protein [Planctomycetota bacterium]|nr:galactokinase family protein [Planctomycetota bacterium]